MTDDRTDRQALQHYEMQGATLRPHDLKAGLPAIRSAVHRKSGLPVIVKSWPRRETLDDHELEEIWRHEIRQLQRLVSYPGAADRLTILQDSAELDDAFYLMLANDHRLPLQRWLDNPRSTDWFKTPRTSRHRLRLWEEILRISEGLEVLHAQGLVHRNIDTWSVLTSVGENADFLLTGFEWSIRLTSAATGQQRRRAGTAAQKTTRYSFYEDWRAVGFLACRLLNFPSRAKPGDAYLPNVEGEADFLLAAERDLLTLLLAADPLSRLDARVIAERIGLILDGLRAQLTGSEPRLVLAVGVGSQTGLTTAIYNASRGQIEVEDEEDQLLFIRQDLGEEPRLVRLKGGERDRAPSYVLRGRLLTYKLRQFINQGSATWAIARCTDAEEQGPAHARIQEDRPLGAFPIDIGTLGEAAYNAPRLIGTTTRWDQVLGAAPADPLDNALQDKTYGALVLFQVLETLVEASQIWPVEVVEARSVKGQRQLTLRCRTDDALDRLAKALDLKPPAIRLRSVLDSEQVSIDGEWRLTDEALLGMRGSDRAVWTLVQANTGRTPETYVFEGPGPEPTGNVLYLRSGGDGQDRLLQRKLKALKSLREHGELLAMLASPRLQRRPSHDRWNLEHLAGTLDASKMQALRELWSVLPLYLLQGPPGVGKTKLVQELVAARVSSDGSDRILLTAQSHAAVDHLLETVRAELERRREPGTSDPVLALRCRPRDHGSGTGDWDLSVRAGAIARELATSDLAQEAPAHIRKRLAELVSSLREGGEPADPPVLRSAIDRSFQSLVLRSANLVFASTNARELETLIQERAQFDWSIVEEAGKATGVDLLAPLLLSHRRLMIGDHKQLPPFNSDQMEKLFASPARIEAALDVGRHLVARPFGQAGIEDALDFVASADIEELSGAARSMMLLFETMIEAETKAPKKAGRLSMGMQLDRQHRMHPAIGRLVADSFYPGSLETAQEAVDRFAAKVPPMRFVDGSALIESPILFVDMPFAHANVRNSSPELQPRWKNRPEANACIEVLRRLRAGSNGRPEVAVLTPYRAQQRELQDSISAARRSGKLENLAAFDEVGGDLCHTVDSFQGNEADTVIISLVRNNGHAGSKALGFLSDKRRMNVLMSRARWKLVLVGSLQFLRARFQAELPAVDDEKLAFLRRWLATLDELCVTHNSDGVPMAKIVPIADLLGDGA